MGESDQETLLLVAERLQSENPRRFAQIMGEMSPVFAARLTTLLRARADPPDTAVEAEARLAVSQG